MEHSLTISRRLDEYIDITVGPADKPTVLSVGIVGISGNQIKINCRAPKSVSILRRELTKVR